MKSLYLSVFTCLALAACDDPGPSPATARSTSGAALTCEAQSERALEAVQDVQADADRTCSVDADCALVTAATRCVSACLHHDAVAKRALASLNDEIARLDAQMCGAFAHDAPIEKGTQASKTCEAAIPLSSECTIAHAAYCKAGQCAHRLVAP